MGGDILATPLTRVINNLIKNGTFPTVWKKAMVTPLLKKGDPKEKTNYRPVNCLAAASKVLEKIVCQQITRHMESNNLLRDSQHGFREKRYDDGFVRYSEQLDRKYGRQNDNRSPVLGPLNSVRHT